MPINNPFLSVCIFTYNRSKYLEQVLESIKNNIRFAQTSECTVEIIISDNASSDNTQEVVNKFQNFLPVRYYRNDYNIGADKNLRMSTSFAQGDYIWLLSDDDIIYDGALFYLLNFLKSHLDISYIFYPRIFANQNLEISNHKPQPKGVINDMIFESGKELFIALNGQMPSIIFFVSSTIIKRKIWEETARIFPADIQGWSHAKPILSAIKGNKCAILKQNGIICRLGNSRDINSKIWFDNYISIFLFAKQLGYSETHCDAMIKDIILYSANKFVFDKMFGTRQDKVTECLTKLGCRELLIKETIFTYLSRLPVMILKLGLPLYFLNLNLKLFQKRIFAKYIL